MIFQALRQNIHKWRVRQIMGFINSSYFQMIFMGNALEMYRSSLRLDDGNFQFRSSAVD
jgi:hypothetical protein